jgi:fatty acid desaturase
MTTSHDRPAQEPQADPDSRRGRRVAALLAVAAPLAVGALASAPVAAAFPTAAPPAAAHASAMLTASDCVTHFGVHHAAKLPACLGD